MSLGLKYDVNVCLHAQKHCIYSVLQLRKITTAGYGVEAVRAVAGLQVDCHLLLCVWSYTL